jgi:formamidopyrimidine-DNA glycosylase
VPELADVEHFRRIFARHSNGRRVQRVVVTDPGILRNVSAPELDRALRGHRFEEPERHGKWLIARTDGPALLVHFGMTGDISWAADSTGRHPHDRLILDLEQGELRYRNMRKLGGVWLAANQREVDGLLDRLGPDAFSVGRKEFLERLGRRRGRVKAALMDQSLVAGVGNLLGDEVLWRARIHPARQVSDLSGDENAALFRALRSVIRQAVDLYEEGSPSRWMRVRGRPGARCPRCRTELARILVGGRGTYFCPACQR